MQKITRAFIKIVGILLIIIGLIGAYYGPLEIYVFYFFSEGGRFHYDGFGVGSLWFAYLVVQNLGYYIVAALFIPVGIGHLQTRKWALTLTQLYLWFWLGTGVLLLSNALILIPKVLKTNLSRGVLYTRLGIIGVSLFFLLILLPGLAIWFYKSNYVQQQFKSQDANQYWTGRYPFPLMALLLLFIIMIAILHIAIFLQGLFPMFGSIMLGRQSIYIISLCILILGILFYGTVRLKKWAWWGSLIFVLLLTISSILTFSRHSFYDMILLMNLPTFEMELIDSLHLQGTSGAPCRVIIIE